MNAGLGMGLPAEGFAASFGLPTPNAAATSSHAAALAQGAAGADEMNGRFAALLAAIEVGTPAQPGDGMQSSEAQAAEDQPRANGREVMTESMPRESVERAASSLTRWRDFIVGVVEPAGRQSNSNVTAPVITSALPPTQTPSTTRVEQMTAPEYEISPEVEAMMQSLAAIFSPPRAEPVATAAAHTMTAPPADAERAVVVGTDAAIANLEGLHPELKIRVERVITRMQEEFGHTVEVVETLRSQARQNALYAQGRSKPGEIVTWTRDSLHRDGKAADLRVDGAWTNREAYSRLQQVAQEEGLTTIGDKDAGHVEWRVAGERTERHSHHRDAQRAAAAQSATATPEALPALADVARPARVARVARVAQAAEVARVARPGATLRARPSTKVETSDGATRAANETLRAASLDLPSNSGAEPRPEMPVVAPLESPTAAALPVQPSVSADSAAASVRSDVTANAAPTSLTERIDRIDTLDDTRRQQPLQSITLRVEDAQGQDHRIRVDLRGTEVHTDITAATSAQARAIADSVPELKQRLGAQGLETAGVQVRTWLSDAAPSGDRQTSQRDGQPSQHQQSQQEEKQSHRDPRQSHQAPRHWFDVEGDNV